MKKIYESPETIVQNVELQQMIAASEDTISVGSDYNGSSAIESRRGGSLWDDED